jgi:hypothetical protein
MAVGLRCGLQGTIFAQDIHDDALDTGLGRPPIGKVPMTGAERVRLYRLKHAAAKPVPKPTADNVAATIDELQKDLARPSSSRLPPSANTGRVGDLPRGGATLA